MSPLPRPYELLSPIVVTDGRSKAEQVRMAVASLGYRMGSYLYSTEALAEVLESVADEPGNGTEAFALVYTLGGARYRIPVMTRAS